VVECGGLENRCAERHRGFESLSLRHASPSGLRAADATLDKDAGYRKIALTTKGEACPAKLEKRSMGISRIPSNALRMSSPSGLRAADATLDKDAGYRKIALTTKGEACPAKLEKRSMGIYPLRAGNSFPTLCTCFTSIYCGP
jgi:hypothetical protein